MTPAMSTEDRRLLEMAAKAAGLNATFWGRPEGPWQCRLDVNTDARAQGVKWDPLNDDGDALRLAVKLKIVPQHAGRYVVAIILTDTLEISKHEDYGDDPYAATRRCIVRAAASIGEAMK